MSRRRLASTVMIGFIACSTSIATADALSDLADKCIAALAAGDQPGFEAASNAIRQRDDVFNTEARERAEACLSQGYGETWEYWYPTSSFEPRATIEARINAAADAKLEEERAAAQAEGDAAKAEANRAENAKRVAALVYVSCFTLFTRDKVAAMTNPVCVDSFLQTGLPASAAP